MSRNGACQCPGQKCVCSCHPTQQIFAVKKSNASNLPKGEPELWKEDLVSSSMVHLTAKQPDPALRNPENQDFHHQCHFKFGEDKNNWQTISQTQFANKKGGKAAKADIDPYKSSLPKGDVAPADWGAQLATTNSQAFVNHGSGLRTPFDPSLQKTQYTLGTDQDDYKTTQQQFQAHHGSDLALNTQRRQAVRRQHLTTTIPKGDVDAWREDLMSSQKAMLNINGTADRYDRNPDNQDFHGQRHIAVVGDGSTDQWKTMNQTDFLRHGNAQAEKAKIDPYKSSLPKGDVDPRDWASSLTTTNREGFINRPEAKRTAFDPNLQKTQFSFGEDAPDYHTTSKQFLTHHRDNAARQASKDVKERLLKSTLPKGDVESWRNEELHTMNGEHLIDHGPAARGKAMDKGAHTQSSYKFGEDPNDWSTTNRTDLDEKHGARRARANIDPYKSSLPKGDMDAKDWGQSLRTTNKDSLKNHGNATRTPFDPNLQKTQFDLGSEKTDYGTTTGQFKHHHHHDCCPCTTQRM
eukprot:TRINITY_DN4228_c0_g1_i2.p1 TRINITY_DN4228_c0_g1~~TRINITY_DN4228_c0_g1_i2.p1  ORF type:complete len:521 (+),score=127.69 TRINITY_DN4228_c0_g1_i2:233-1795(+)